MTDLDPHTEVFFIGVCIIVASLFLGAAFHFMGR